MKRSLKNRVSTQNNRISNGGIPARKISETLLDFAEPLLSLLPGDVPEKLLEQQLKVPITIWNAIVMEELGDMPNVLSEARARVMKSGLPMMLMLFDTLVQRKRSQFGDDYRLIGRYSVRRAADGSLNIKAEARWRGRPVPHGSPQSG